MTKPKAGDQATLFVLDDRRQPGPTSSGSVRALMRRRCMAPIIFALLLHSTAVEGPRPAAKPSLNPITFVPNQLAANLWYSAGPNHSLINGHIEGSFSEMTLWPALRHHLAASSGALGITGAAELAQISARTLSVFRNAGLTTSVGDPTFTQCRDGKTLGQLSFLGQHQQLFCSIFKICPPGMLARGGWYQNSNDTAYIPDEITMDERMPHSLSSPQHLEQLWNQSLRRQMPDGGHLHPGCRSHHRPDS